MQSGRVEYRDVRPALLTCPGQQWLGPFCIHGSNEQIFGPNEQVLGRGSKRPRDVSIYDEYQIVTMRLSAD
jgi:hypothetical protein